MSEKVSVRELFAVLGLEIDEQGFERAGALIEGLKTGLVETIGAVAGAVTAFTAIGVSTAHAGVEAWKAAQSLGITTDAVQELENVADEALISTDELQQGLKFLARNAAEAANGGAEMTKTFQALGITLDKNNLPPVDQLLETVADRFRDVIPEAQKTNVAMKLFGRSGAQLVGTLNLGADRIRELRQEAHELGIVLDQSAIEKSLEFGRGIKTLEDNLKGLKYAIGVPVLTVINGFIRALLAATRVIREFFRGEFPKAMAVFRAALIAAGLALTAFGIANAGVIAETIAGWVAMGVAAVAEAAVVAAAWVTANWPFVLLAGAILIAAVALEDLYAFLTDKRSVMGDFLDDIGLAGRHFNGLKGHIEAAARAAALFFGIITGRGVGALVELDRIVGWAAGPIPTLTGRGPSDTAAQSLAANGVYTPGSSSPMINVTVTPLPGMDEAALAEMTGRQIRDQLDSITRAAKEAIP